MKFKILQLISVFLLLFVFTSICVYAAPDSNSAVRFYIHYTEQGTDKLLEVNNVSTSINKNIESGFELTIGDGVTEEDIISCVSKEPDDDKILKFIQQKFEKDGYCLVSEDGTVYDISQLTAENFSIEWYCIYYSDHWCVNGRIKSADGSNSVSITDDVISSDEDENLPELPVNGLPNYSSDYAYIFGYNDTNMGADGALLRCELSAMVHRLAKQNNHMNGFVYNESKEPYYADIDGEWFRSAIEFMQYNGAFTNEKGSNINPYAVITRGEAFRLICIGLGFTADTSMSYEEYADLLKNAGYIEGDENGNLNISDYISRAEFCTIYNRVIGRDNAKLVTADGETITAETYGFDDLSEDDWYYETMLKATSAYDDSGYVDLTLRGVRNDLDDYE